MADVPLILVLTASAGAGHNIAAEAVAAALQRRAPQTRVEVLDVLSISNSFFRRLYADGYLGLVRHAPAAMGLLYDAMDTPQRPVRENVRLLIQNLNKLPTTRYLRLRSPRLIVNTHFLPAEFVAQLRSAGELSTPQVTVTTDFETHRLWVQEPTERYYTATEDGKYNLTTWGVAPERIVVSGIPVRAGFEQPADIQQLRDDYRLDRRLPVVLLLSGGFGVGPTVELLRELLSMPVEAQIIVSSGRNERLRARLEALRPHAQRPLRIIGYTPAMHDWIHIADLVVTKPGGLTVAEALVCGVPLIIINPIPGQETRNADYLLEQGAGIKVNSPRLLGYRVSQLLRDPKRLRALRDAARLCARPGAADRIAADALAIAGL